MICLNSRSTSIIMIIMTCLDDTLDGNLSNFNARNSAHYFAHLTTLALSDSELKCQ